MAAFTRAQAKQAIDLLALLVPYAHSRAEDIADEMDDTPDGFALWSAANAAVDAAYKLLAELGRPTSSQELL